MANLSTACFKLTKGLENINNASKSVAKGIINVCIVLRTSTKHYANGKHGNNNVRKGIV